MRLKNFLIILCLYVINISSFSQDIHNNISVDNMYEYAVEVYNSKNYNTASKLFKTIYLNNLDLSFNEKANSLYFLSKSYMNTEDYDAALKYYNLFLNNYSESIHINKAKLDFAQIKFLKHDYREAINTYDQINPNDLNQKEREKYYFNVGYANLRTRKYSLALANFAKIKDTSEEYWNAASYYYAYILFEENNYNEAYPIFKQLENDPEYGTESKHYLIRILSYEGKYTELLKIANALPKTNGRKDNKETQAIIAEAYYKTKQYNKAIPLLEEAIKLHPTPSFYYYLGESYYNERNYNKALSNFEKAAVTKDEAGQTASYYVGLCNLQTGNHKFAANAFHNAYKMNFNSDITEAALFNYANTVYETGFDPFNEAISGLQTYLQNNKNTKRYNEAQTLLANLFLSTKNYQHALHTINSIDIISDNLKTAHQKINYSSAIEEYYEKNFSEAIKMFKESQKYGLDKKLSAEAQYWIADCYYKKGNYTDAAIDYKKFLKMPKAPGIDYYDDAYYSLGYCYFKQKRYQEAQTYFNKYINTSTTKERDKKSDAWSRIGDCYFISNQFSNAVNAYDNAVNMKTDKSGYPQYYKALALGAKGDLNAKAMALKDIENMPIGTYFRSNALFEMGNNYVVMENNDAAIATYEKLIAEYPRSPYNIKAKQKIGLLYFGMENYNLAERYFKDIIETYPGTLEAQESIASLKNIYIAQNKVDAFMSYIKTNTNINIRISEADSMSFAGAQNLFTDKQYDKAKLQLNNYIKEFPEGAFRGTAFYYLGECYFIEKDYAKAATNFESALNYPHSLYTESSKIQLAGIYMQQENYYNAIRLYKELINSTEYDYVANEANINLMRCYYNTSEYDNLSKQCAVVKKIDNLDKDIQNETKYYNAYALYGLGQYDAAYNEFSEISKKMKNVIGAESKYFCAFIKYINEDYTKAEEEAFELINKFSNYDFWVARGFILLGDIYVKTGNTFQARQTYQSIIDNYKGDDLKSEAQSKLDKIVEE